VRRAASAVSVGVVILATLASAAPAGRASFPGTNGPVAFAFSGGSIVTENVDGSNRKTVVPLTTGVSVAATEPAWSADGTKLAYSSKQGNTGGIYIVNADGSNVVRVTQDVNDGEPTWSPDGKKLAFIHVSNGRRRLVTTNVDGSGLFVVTPTLERTLDDPEWSPDGTRLTFSDFADVYVVNVDGSGLLDLTADSGHPSRADNPTWSPDGSRIAFTYNISQIQVVAAGGGATTTLGSNLGEVWEISWAPDGTKIAFIADVNGPLQEELFLMNADGTNIVRTNIDVATTLDWGVAAAPVVPPPVTGVNVNIAPVSGTVLVKLKGAANFTPLTALSSVPVGSELDLTKGRIRLTSTGAAGATQTAVFYQGRAVVGQTRAATPVTTLTLSGPLVCPKRKVSAKKPPSRSLWGNGTGNYITTGRYAAATVRGTVWLTQDTCNGTLIRVQSGTVSVFDKVKKRTVIVRAGKSYLAKKKP
jgi:dipeptidyl aminopeptidase/acylaminoacyl peptidase